MCVASCLRRVLDLREYANVMYARYAWLILQCISLSIAHQRINQHLLQGVPKVYLERQNEGSGNCFRATIEANPPPCSVQWRKKGNDQDEFKPIDANAEEFRGTTDNLPHPTLVVKDRTLLEKNCFQIVVSNSHGSTTENISSKRHISIKHAINNKIVLNK